MTWRCGILLRMAPLEIRPVEDADVPAIWRIARQPGVIETTMTLPSERLERRRSRIEAMGDADHLLVAARAGEVLGWGGLHVGAGRRRHAADLGIGIATAHQGQGVGTALLEALLDLADGWLGLRRVELTVLTGNDRARRLYERAGFEVEGRLRGSVVAYGALADVWVMGRLAPGLERAAGDQAGIGSSASAP